VSSSGKKTDNVSLATKIELRRWLLEQMAIREANVLDTCAGAGHVWTAMREHVTVARWIRCDTKPRQAGTLKMEALDAVKTLPLADFNVVDIDPYGEPWAPYRELLARLTRPVAVFLTHGHVMQSQVATANLEAVGIPQDWDVPRTPDLSKFVAHTLLQQTWHRADILHAAQVHFPRVTYYALGLRPLAHGDDARG
jgi:hypothetical protein